MAPGVIFIPPLGLWHAFIIKLSRTLRFLLVESPVQKKNENVQFLAFCIRDHLPIKRPRKPLLSLYINARSRESVMTAIIKKICTLFPRFKFFGQSFVPY